MSNTNFLLNLLVADNSTSSTVNNVISGLDIALGDAETFIWKIISQYVCSIGALVILCVLIFMLVKGGITLEDMHSQMVTHSLKMITLLVILIALSTFSAWGWIMLGN